MDIALFLLAFAVLWNTSQAIQCYRCVPDRRFQSKAEPLCEAFNYNASFIVDCPNSTGCTKQETELLSLGVTTKIVERDCAHQTMSGDQEKVDGQWKPVNKIYEDAYQEGCQEESNTFNKPTKATQCFCKGDLCNNADSFTRSVMALIVTILLWVLLK